MSTVGPVRVHVAVRAMVDDLTPGQRWTASLAAGLAALVLAFGLPSSVRTIIPSSERRSAGEQAAPVDPGVMVEPVDPRPVAPPARGDGAAVRPAPTAEPTPPDEPAPLQVVALVDGSISGDRGDARIAELFLDDAGVQARTVAFDPADPGASCGQLAGAGLVVAGGPVPPALRSCTDPSAVTMGWDDDLAATDERSLSTRRGVARSLLDTAARIGRDLPGPVVVVGDERFRAPLRDSLGAASALGLPIQDAVWLPDEGSVPPDAVIGLAGTGVRTVLFATSTQRQALLAAQLMLLTPGARFVVLDAADSVLAGDYSLVFDGATAVSAIQHPWHPGDAETRTACRTRWEQEQDPAQVADDQELLRVLTWCQHASLVAAITKANPRTVLDGLRGLRVRSPLTTAVDLHGFDFGPRTATVAQWSADCTCWQSDQPSTEVHAT